MFSQYLSTNNTFVPYAWVALQLYQYHKRKGPLS